jgi:hypothetical protein
MNVIGASVLPEFFFFKYIYFFFFLTRGLGWSVTPCFYRTSLQEEVNGTDNVKEVTIFNLPVWIESISQKILKKWVITNTGIICKAYKHGVTLQPKPLVFICHRLMLTYAVKMFIDFSYTHIVLLHHGFI